MKIVFFVILVFLAAVGITHIIFETLFLLFRNKKDKTILLIIPDKNNADVEFCIRSAVAKTKKFGAYIQNKVVLIDDNLNEKQINEVDILKRDFEFIDIMSSNDFKDKYFQS